jgi:hypothetical protein
MLARRSPLAGRRVSDLCKWLRQALDVERAWLVRLAVVVLLGCALYTPQCARAQSICASCQIQVGVGGTYHFWGQTGGVVLPITVAWSQNRYEVGVFRFATQQTLTEAGTRSSRLMADPYWGVSASRRWRLYTRGRVQAYFGFGLAFRTESDALSVTRWDFASQFGLRLRLPGNRLAELGIRHWSNGGVRLPNHGQDFATLTVLFN